MLSGDRFIIRAFQSDRGCDFTKQYGKTNILLQLIVTTVQSVVHVF